MSSKKNRSYLILWIAVLLLLPIACNLGESGEATVSALAESVALTATAAVGGELSNEAKLATAQAQATEQALNMEATLAASGAGGAERAATATAFAPYTKDFHLYGLNPANGRPAWVHPYVRLEMEGYQANDSANEYAGTVVRDFAISSDITWETQYGTSGCGFVLRSDGNQEEPSQYMLLITRGSLGHVIFAIMAEGEFVDYYDYYAGGTDSQFDWHNGATNRLTVVGRGKYFSVYTNGTFIVELETGNPPEQQNLPSPPSRPEDTNDAQAMAEFEEEMEEYEKEMEQIEQQMANRDQPDHSDADVEYLVGFVSLVGISESGRTVCEFDNTWLWLIEN
jgi:hypothetical protein